MLAAAYTQPQENAWAGLARSGKGTSLARLEKRLEMWTSKVVDRNRAGRPNETAPAHGGGAREAGAVGVYRRGGKVGNVERKHQPPHRCSRSGVPNSRKRVPDIVHRGGAGWR
jgi:hypothetical protein